MLYREALWLTLPFGLMLSMTQRGKHCHLVWCWVWHREANTAILYEKYDTEANTAILYDVEYDTERQTLPSCSVQFSSVPDWLGHRGEMKDDSAEILFQSFLQEAVVSSSDMGSDVHSLILSVQHFLYVHTPHTFLPSCMMLNVVTQRGKQVTAILYDVEFNKDRGECPAAVSMNGDESTCF